MVGAVRFELTTSCTRNKRATRLRYAPTLEQKKLPSASVNCNPNFSNCAIISAARWCCAAAGRGRSPADAIENAVRAAAGAVSYLARTGAYRSATRIGRATTSLGVNLDEGNPARLDMETVLAKALALRGSVGEAHRILGGVLDVKQRTLGLEDPASLDTLEVIALLLHRQVRRCCARSECAVRCSSLRTDRDSRAAATPDLSPRRQHSPGSHLQSRRRWRTPRPH